MGISGGRHRRSGAIGAPLILACLALASVAQAHKVTVFAWVEGREVAGEAYFAGGDKAKDCPIDVYDPSGEQLLETRTNDAGEFRFPIPAVVDLKIVVRGGEGHQNEFILPASDLEEAAGEGAVASPASAETPAPASAPSVEPAAAPSVDSAQLEAAVERALDKKLGPINKKLAELSQKRITVSDVVGGVGFVLGLFGAVALTRKSGGAKRRDRNDSP